MIGVITERWKRVRLYVLDFTLGQSFGEHIRRPWSQGRGNQR